MKRYRWTEAEAFRRLQRARHEPPYHDGRVGPERAQRHRNESVIHRAASDVTCSREIRRTFSSDRLQAPPGGVPRPPPGHGEKFAGDSQRHAQMVGWQTGRNAIRPLDQANPVAVEVFLRHPGRRTRPRSSNDKHRNGKIGSRPEYSCTSTKVGLVTMRLSVTSSPSAMARADASCPHQNADEGDDGTRPKALSQSPAERPSRGQIGQIDNHRGS